MLNLRENSQNPLFSSRDRVLSNPGDLCYPKDKFLNKDYSGFCTKHNMRYEKQQRYDQRDAFQIYLKEIAQFPLLTRDEEVSLAKRIREGDNQARTTMIRSNLRLVVKVAHDYENMGVPLLDLISEGNIGLMKATNRYDGRREVKFSTYAIWWIKQGIRRAIANQSKTIRLPIHVSDNVLRLNKVSYLLSGELEREPRADELAERLNLSEHKVEKLLMLRTNPMSLDAPLDSSNGDEDNKDFGSTLKDPNQNTSLEVATRGEALNELHKALSEYLDKRELGILELRFGLNKNEPLSLEGVGKVYHITRERVRQIQEIALHKLRKQLSIRFGSSNLVEILG